MLIAVHWREWLRQPEVDRFDANSAIAVEDYLQANLPTDRTAFVFDDTDRPMVQAITSQWGNGRFSNRQLREIYNALVAPDRQVRNFKDRDTTFTQLACQLIAMGKDAVPYRITTEGNPMAKTPNATDAAAELEQGAAGTTNATTETSAPPAGATADDKAADTARAAAESTEETKAAIAARKKAEKEAAAAKAKTDREALAAKKKADKEAEKAAAKAAKPKGVIKTLMDLLLDGKKRTVDELYDILAVQFPERGEGMKTTIRVQLVRLNKEGHLVVHSEDRTDSEGKKLAGKAYWGTAVPTKVGATNVVQGQGAGAGA